MGPRTGAVTGAIVRLGLGGMLVRSREVVRVFIRAEGDLDLGLGRRLHRRQRQRQFLLRGPGPGLGL